MKSIGVGLGSAIIASAITYLVLEGGKSAREPGGESTASADGISGGKGPGGNEGELSAAQKAKLRLKEDETLQLEEIGVLRRQPLARFRTVDFRRKVNPIALKAAGLTDAEMEAVQQDFDRAWMDAEQLISENAKVIAPKSDGEPYVVEVKAEVEKGNELLDSLRKSLEGRYGAKAAEILLSGFDDGRMLGSFGRQNQHIELQYNEDNKDWRVTFSNSNPLTGEATIKGRAFLDKFEETNGGWVLGRINLPR
jgi:hypothetical protein